MTIDGDDRTTALALALNACGAEAADTARSLCLAHAQLLEELRVYRQLSESRIKILEYVVAALLRVAAATDGQPRLDDVISAFASGRRVFFLVDAPSANVLNVNIGVADA